LIRDYGIKVGFATANEEWNYPSGYAFATNINSISRQGIDVGIFVEWFDIPFISLLTELQYIQNGTDSRTGVFFRGINFNLVMEDQFYSRNYFSIPLLAKIRWDGTLITPYVLAGARLNVYLNNRGDIYSIPLDGPKDGYVGGTFGIGIETSSMLQIHFGAEFRYNTDFHESDVYLVGGVNNRLLEFLIVLSY